MTEYLEVGKIVNTHGVKGMVKVIPLTDSPERFKTLKDVFINKGTGDPVSHRVEKVILRNTFVLVKFSGIDTRDEAEGLKNSFMEVDRANAIKLPRDSFFICDILGMDVLDLKSREKYGVLTHVLKTGGNDVFQVKREGQRDLLIPALKKVINKVDFEKRQIEVTLPEGLLD